jgi:hypothetical protein
MLKDAPRRGGARPRNQIPCRMSAAYRVYILAFASVQLQEFYSSGMEAPVEVL